MNILILREEELYFFSPPTSTQRRPDEEQDDVAKFAFEVLFYNNILQQPLRAKQHIARSKGCSEYAERFGGNFHRYIILGDYMHVIIKYLLAFSRNLINLIYCLVATLFSEYSVMDCNRSPYREQPIRYR